MSKYTMGYKVSELIEKLKNMPQDRTVLLQVVDQEGHAWNMCYDISNIDSSDWIVCITASHPQLKKLPMPGEAP